MKSTSARESLWDYARGIGIILVVYGHVLRGLASGGLVPDGHPVMASDFALYTFHMPLFFLLAGMNAPRGVTRDGFLKSKIMTIIYPYLLWSVLQGGLQVMMAGSTNHRMHWSDVLGILWQPILQFWFLYALMLCHVFAWLTKADRLKVALLALIVYPIGIYFSLPYMALSMALSFFFFYAAGVLLADHLKDAVLRLANPLGIAVTAGGFAVALYVASKMSDYHAPSALPAAFLGILLVLQVAAILPDRGPARIIGVLGLASMPIYLMHVLAASAFRMVLVKLGVSNLYVHLVLGTLVGLLVPLVAYYVVYLLKQEKLLGFSSGAMLFGRVGGGTPVLKDKLG